MADVQKMLEALECHFKPIGEENCSECRYECSKASWTKIQDQLALDLIEFLKDQAPRLLTLKELDKILFDTADAYANNLWMEVKSKRKISFGIVELNFSTVVDDGYEGLLMGCSWPVHYRKDTYGIVWRCWSSRPTDEQRGIAKWEKSTSVSVSSG